MKKQILIIALLLGGFTLPSHAQIGIGVNINLQPVWGPTGYDHAEYYYIPDIDAYYNVARREYTWNEGGRWITDISLPPRYASFDLYHAYKAVINEPNPWMHHDRYRKQYMGYRDRHDQEVIRDSHDARYYANPGHPEHRTWMHDRRDQPRDHGHDWEIHQDNQRHDEHHDNRRDEHHDDRH